MILRIGRGSILAVGLLTAALTLMASTSAAAHVVEVTTSLSIDQVEDKAQLKEALRSEVDRVLATTIAFKPTMIALTEARQVGKRLMVRLLIADEDGERLIEELEGAAGEDKSGDRMRL
jgi:hypothetical protein